MSFKLALILVIAGLVAACGVKSPPLIPAESVIPSYEEKFIEKEINDSKKIDIEEQEDMDQ
ncbi:MAG: hypothetical protein A2202_04040 [Bdellovibrionales bacterium RIFOXYA1_FULL_36_14]|nr:MAG: hypothetical protein A2202_04040 [Bdellovibrionales bacterium RIFOXYA1_FULL_36_14]